jgi:hypothetical protein
MFLTLFFTNIMKNKPCVFNIASSFPHIFYNFSKLEMDRLRVSVRVIFGSDSMDVTSNLNPAACWIFLNPYSTILVLTSLTLFHSPISAKTLETRI